MRIDYYDGPVADALKVLFAAKLLIEMKKMFGEDQKKGDENEYKIEN